MDEFFEDVKFLTSFIGCNIFEIIKTKEQQDLHLFYTTGRGYNAKGYYNASGFTVLKGSMIKKDSVPSLNWKVKRELLIKKCTSLQDGVLIMNSDMTFSSPSTAAIFCIGRNTNGWKKWKDKDGNTLDFIYRKQLN